MRSDTVFYNSLPLSGFEGTMDRTFWSKNKNIRAKTGTLDHVKALSGYIKAQSGDEIVFSFLVNHYLVDMDKIIYIQKEFCDITEKEL